MAVRQFFGEILFWFHVAFLLFWYSLFLVPRSWWPGKIVFHFYLTVFVVIQQLVWGFLIMPWTKKYRMVCFLTTAMQVLRGQEISDPKNYEYSFVKETFGRVGFTLPHRGSSIITFTILFFVTIQLFLFH